VRGGQGAALLFLDQGEQPPGAAQGGDHGAGERHLQRLYQHQHRWHPRRWERRRERALLPYAGGSRRAAHPAAGLLGAHQRTDARQVPAGCHPRDQAGSWLSVGLQSGGVRGRAAAPGQIAGGCPRGGLQRLHRGGGLREGGLPAYRLPQCAQDPGGDAQQRDQSGDGHPGRVADR